MSSALERRVAKLEHEQRIDREQIIELSAAFLDILRALDPEAFQQASDDVAVEFGHEPGGEWVLKPYGSETN